MTELARELDALAHAHCAWVRLHYVYPYRTSTSDRR